MSRMPGTPWPTKMTKMAQKTEPPEAAGLPSRRCPSCSLGRKCHTTGRCLLGYRCFGGATPRKTHMVPWGPWTPLLPSESTIQRGLCQKARGKQEPGGGATRPIAHTSDYRWESSCEARSWPGPSEV